MLCCPIKAGCVQHHFLAVSSHRTLLTITHYEADFLFIFFFYCRHTEVDSHCCFSFREKELAKVTIKKEDVELIVSPLPLPSFTLLFVAASVLLAVQLDITAGRGQAPTSTSSVTFCCSRRPLLKTVCPNGETTEVVSAT